MIYIYLGATNYEIRNPREIKIMNKHLNDGKCPICFEDIRERSTGLSCDECKRHFIATPRPVTMKEQFNKDYFRL